MILIIADCIREILNLDILNIEHEGNFPLELCTKQGLTASGPLANFIKTFTANQRDVSPMHKHLA